MTPAHFQGVVVTRQTILSKCKTGLELQLIRFSSSICPEAMGLVYLLLRLLLLITHCQALSAKKDPSDKQKWKPKYHNHSDSISYLMPERRQQVAACVVTGAQYGRQSHVIIRITTSRLQC